MCDATRLPRAQRRAAVAGAASTVLAYLYPDRAAFFEELAERERPRIGVVRGRLIGRRVVARARRDGSDAVFQGPIPVGPGLWVPTPPAFLPPLEPLASTWRPWNFGTRSSRTGRSGP
jgi:hypothetical protein